METTKQPRTTQESRTVFFRKHNLGFTVGTGLAPVRPLPTKDVQPTNNRKEITTTIPRDRQSHTGRHNPTSIRKRNPHSQQQQHGKTKMHAKQKASTA